MPAFSCFTAFGLLEFSSEPSEAEKMYASLLNGYRDPKTGLQTIDTTIGTYKEAVLYGWAMALGGARVTLRRAGNELRPETSYTQLEAHEEKFGMSPGAEDDVPTRRLALSAAQKAARGPRFEAVHEALLAILGDDLVAYRPMTIAEAEAYPEDPRLGASPGIFRRNDGVAKSVRILDSITRAWGATIEIDGWSEINETTVEALRDTAAVYGVGQSFTGDGEQLAALRLNIRKVGAPTGLATAKIYAHSGTFGTSSLPGALLATSEPLDVSTLTVGAELRDLNFSGDEAIVLEDGVNYVATLEYQGGSVGNTVDVGYDTVIAAHAGNRVWKAAGNWTAAAAEDLCFHVMTGKRFVASYENWNRSLVEVELVKGDVLCVDSGDLGHAERVVVHESAGTGTTRTFTAAFRKPHPANTHATTGPMPIWTNSKRHVLIVVKAAAAIEPATVRRIHDLFRKMMRGPTTWAIIQPTTPGAATAGPFVIGDTSGSPLGAVPVESITL